MKEQLFSVLESRDLSRAGELFSISDWDLVADLHSVMAKIKDVFSSSDYLNSLNTQSFVEICLGRITSAVRETGTIEAYVSVFIDALEACLVFPLSTSFTGRDAELAPHGKIASDILSSLFQHYKNKQVMGLAVPIAVKILSCHNVELMRSVSSYLALAAIHNSRLLSQYSSMIIRSVVEGNRSLVRILPQIYSDNREPFHSNVSQLTNVLSSCDPAEKLSLLRLFGMLTKNKPQLIIPYVNKIKACLYSPTTCAAALNVYMCIVNADQSHVLADQMTALKKAGDIQGAQNVAMIAKIMSAIGCLEKFLAQDAVNYMVLQCYKLDASLIPVLLKELETIALKFPSVVECRLPELRKLTESGGAAVQATYIRIYEICAARTFNNQSVGSGISSSSNEKVTIISVPGGGDPFGYSEDQFVNAGALFDARAIHRGSGAGVHQPVVTPDTSRRISAIYSSVTSGKESPALYMQDSRPGYRVSGGSDSPRGSVHMIGDKQIYMSPDGRARMVSSCKQRANLSRPKSKSVGSLHSNQPSARRYFAEDRETMDSVPQVVASKSGYYIGTPTTKRLHEHRSDAPLPVGSSPAQTRSSTATPATRRVTNVREAAYRMRNQNTSQFGAPVTGKPVASSRAGHSAAYRAIRDDLENSRYSTSTAASTPSTSHNRRQGTGGRLETTLYGDQAITVRRNSDSASNVMQSASSRQGFSDSPSIDGSHQRIGQSGSFLDDVKPTILHVSGSSSIGSQQNSITPTRYDVPQPKMVSVACQSTATLQSKQSMDQLQSIRPTNANGYPTWHNDAIRQFCEKHLEKIKVYMSDLANKYPVPCQCTVEELKHRQHMRIHFMCQERGEHCLHKTNYFAFKTKASNLWLHLMFLHLQTQSDCILSQSHSAVAKLKYCWECLPAFVTKRRAFAALVTSAFPNFRDQEILLAELQSARYFDLFAFNATNKKWSCFACNHPERVANFLKQQNDTPVLEGQLKEKKGRWKFFKRWRTRYFTLSGATLSYRGYYNETDASPAIDIRQIRSVKSVTNRRNRRQIPKAFEIFTENDSSYMLKAKDHKNAEEWFQCLQIAVAHVHKEKDKL